MSSSNLFCLPDCYIRTLNAFITFQAVFGISEVIILPRDKGDSPHSNFRVCVNAQSVRFCFEIITPSTDHYKEYVNSITELCKHYSITLKLL